MQKWNLAGLALLLVACVFAALDRADAIPWFMLTLGAALWLANERFRKLEAVELLGLFLWALYWGIISAGTFFMAAYAAVAMILGVVFWHFYLYIALSVLFATLAMINFIVLVVIIIRFKCLPEAKQ